MTSKRVLLQLSLAFAVVPLISSQSNTQLPPYINVCKKNEPQLSRCMMKSVEQLRPLLARGIPELDIPPIEPIFIGDLIVAESVPGQGLTITAKGVKAYGPSKFVLKSLNIVDYPKKFSFELELPQLYAEGLYDIDGRILLIPVKGNGKFHGNFTGGTGDVQIHNQRVTKNGKDYILAKKIDIKIRIRNGKLRLDNLFGGDKVLGDVVNETINRNFDLFSAEIIPLIERALSKHFKKVGNKIMSRYSEDILFPDN